METQKQTQHSEFQLDEVNGVSMAVIECHNVGGHQWRMGLTDEMEKRLDIAENVVITVADLNAVGEEMFLSEEDGEICARRMILLHTVDHNYLKHDTDCFGNIVRRPFGYTVWLSLHNLKRKIRKRLKLKR